MYLISPFKVSLVLILMVHVLKQSLVIHISFREVYISVEILKKKGIFFRFAQLRRLIGWFCKDKTICAYVFPCSLVPTVCHSVVIVQHCASQSHSYGYSLAITLFISFCFVGDCGLRTSRISECSSCYSQRLTWLRSIIKVDKPIDTVSLVCMRVKTLSVIPIVAESAGTKLPICARNTIKPTYRKRDEYWKSLVN